MPRQTNIVPDPRLSPPLLISAEETDDSNVKLRWVSTQFNITGFKVYRSGQRNGFYEVVGTTPQGDGWTDEDAPSGETLYYRVTTYNDDGDESRKSVVMSVTTS